tara:strand:+ start:410 stop:1000 length:591 start_codon:yes stop_codon:yes gene_type:complete
MQYDVWAVTPATDDAYYRANASIAGAGALSLLANTVGPNGYGYKLVITSAGDDSGITFTITGIKVGDLTNTVVSEIVTGANATTATSSNFYARVDSITASGASAGNVKIGTTGSLALPRTRVKGLYFVGTATAGTIKFNVNGLSSQLILQINTPASALQTSSLYMAAEGILTTRSTAQDYCVVTLTDVTFVTIICG